MAAAHQTLENLRVDAATGRGPMEEAANANDVPEAGIIVPPAGIQASVARATADRQIRRHPPNAALATMCSAPRKPVWTKRRSRLCPAGARNDRAQIAG